MGNKIKFEQGNKIIFLYSFDKRTWEEKTLSITAIYEAYYYGHFTGYDIYFKGSNIKFFYKAERVRFLDIQENINIEKFDVYVKGELVNATRLDKFEHGYYRVYVGDKIITTKQINLKSNRYKDMLNYYYDLADYAGSIAEPDSPLYFLSQNYKRIKPSRESILYDFVQSECKKIQDNRYILVPFDFNQSQIQAINRALKNKISVVEGPPGTGKTQTILNLVANLIYRGLNCAIVSNNNTAIDNVFEKLSEENLSFIAAALGNKSNVEEFFASDRNDELLAFLEKDSNKDKKAEGSKIVELSAVMKKIQEIEVDTSILKSQLMEIQTEKRHYDNFNDEKIIINQNLPSKDYMYFITRLEKQKKIGLFERWFHRRKFKINIAKQNINVLLSNAEQLYYETKIKELTYRIDTNQRYLLKHNQDETNKKLKMLSRVFLESHIHNHYAKIELNGFDKTSYKKDFQNFLNRYPVILSTSQSLLNNAPKGFTFEYLIVDEASQGDLLSNVLAMNCAKNLVVVGDSRQLQQIDEERLFEQSKKLASKYDIPKSFRYESNSLLMAVKNSLPNIPTTLLKEHYRCAPDIINFCNKMFYDGQLVAMTKNSGKHIEIIKTVPGNHARKNPHGSGLYNQREIDEIKRLIKTSESNSIGVITPFRYQANLIIDQYPSDRIEADTIHKFQGRQKEEIILSFVVNSLDKDPESIENRLYDFVTNEKLLNVAISRGKNKVTAIVADKVYNSTNNSINDFIKYSEYIYGSDVTKESSIRSVFDYLYTEYTNFLIDKFQKNLKGYKTELLMSSLIKDILSEYSYIGYSMHTRLNKIVNIPDNFDDEEKKYILHPWTHVDFLLYNKVSKENLFVLEVDGIRFHEQDKKQTEHDDIKDRILEYNNIPIYRFKTNESNEKHRLIEAIKNVTHKVCLLRFQIMNCFNI